MLQGLYRDYGTCGNVGFGFGKHVVIGSGLEASSLGSELRLNLSWEL